MNRHQIRLRGPWQFFYEKKGNLEQFRIALPTEIGKIRQLVGDEELAQVSTKVGLKRSFHSPTNLEPEDHVRLQIVEPALPGRLQVNSTQSVEFDSYAEMDLSKILKPLNQILIELPAKQFSQLADESLIWKEVLLLIDSEE